MTIKEGTFAPGGAKRCQLAIERAGIGDPISVEPDAGAKDGYVLLDRAGDPLGFFTAKHWVARELAEGREVLHASVNMAAGPQDDVPLSITVRIATGDRGEHFEMPPMLAPRRYPVGIVGEASYQPAIRRCRPGDPVHIVHEIGNPYDAEALAVLAAGGDVIGYIGRDHWLRDSIHEEGRGCAATILSVEQNAKGLIGVVIEATPCSGPIATRRHG